MTIIGPIEQAKEAAKIIRNRPQWGPLTQAESESVAELLESHARMLAAGLPESLKEIVIRDALDTEDLPATRNFWRNSAEDEVADKLMATIDHRTSLLGAVRVLTAERDAIQKELDARRFADESACRDIALIQAERDELKEALRGSMAREAELAAGIEAAKGHPRCLACSQDFTVADEVRVHARSCPGHEVCQLLEELKNVRELWHSENGDGGPTAPSALDCIHMAQGEIKELRGEQEKIAAMVKIWADGGDGLASFMVLNNIALALGLEGR